MKFNILLLGIALLISTVCIGQTAGQIKSDCDAELAKINSEINQLNASYEQKKKDLKDGHFCSKCGKSISEFSSESAFWQHIDDVNATAIATPADYEKAHNDYISKFNELNQNKLRKAKDCGQQINEANAEAQRQLQEERDRQNAETRRRNEESFQKQQHAAEAERKKEEDERQRKIAEEAEKRRKEKQYWDDKTAINEQFKNQMAEADKDRLSKAKAETDQMKNKLGDLADKLTKIVNEKHSQNLDLTNKQTTVKENILNTNSINDEDFDKIMEDTNNVHNGEIATNLNCKWIYYHKYIIHITNNTNKKVHVTGGLNFSQYTFANRIPCSCYDKNGKRISVEDCFSASLNYDCGNDFVLGDGGWSVEGFLWNDKLLIDVTPAWSFHYDYFYLQDNLHFNVTNTSSTAHLELGPDPVQANTPLQIETHGVQPIGTILFEDKGIIFSYSVEEVRERRMEVCCN